MLNMAVLEVRTSLQPWVSKLCFKVALMVERKCCPCWLREKTRL